MPVVAGTRLFLPESSGIGEELSLLPRACYPMLIIRTHPSWLHGRRSPTLLTTNTIVQSFSRMVRVPGLLVAVAV